MKFQYKETIIKGLDALVVISIFGAICFPFKQEYGTILTDSSDFATFFGFGIVISTIGLKNSTYFKSIINKIDQKDESLNMQQPGSMVLASQLATAEYNSVIEINKIILELKKCDSKALNIGRIHNGWALFFDTLSDYYYSDKVMFYDAYLNKYFSEFLNYLNCATNKFSCLAIPESIHEIGIVNMWSINMDISSYGISDWESPDDGLNDLTSAFKKWESLKQLATNKYENLC